MEATEAGAVSLDSDVITGEHHVDSTWPVEPRPTEKAVADDCTMWRREVWERRMDETISDHCISGESGVGGLGSPLPYMGCHCRTWENWGGLWNLG